jgi:hypothetical protein
MTTRVLVLHAKQPTFFAAAERVVARSDYDEVAQLDLPQPGTAALDAAYSQTQNIDDAWRPQAPCRSTSVGDILVLDGAHPQAFEVAMMGFEPISLR